MPLTTQQQERLRRFVDDQGRTIGNLETQSFVLPDLTVAHGLTLHRGQREIQVLFLGRGHTRGDVVVYLPQDRTVITGDLLTHPTLHVGGSSRPVEWLDSLGALQELDFDIAIPGHGEVIRGRDYLDLMVVLLDEVVTQVRDGLEQGLKHVEIEPRVSLEDARSHWVGDDRERANTFEAAREFVPDAIGRAYLELTGRLD